MLSITEPLPRCKAFRINELYVFGEGKPITVSPITLLHFPNMHTLINYLWVKGTRGWERTLSLYATLKANIIKLLWFPGNQNDDCHVLRVLI